MVSHLGIEPNHGEGRVVVNFVSFWLIPDLKYTKKTAEDAEVQGWIHALHKKWGEIPKMSVWKHFTSTNIWMKGWGIVWVMFSAPNFSFLVSRRHLQEIESVWKPCCQLSDVLPNHLATCTPPKINGSWTSQFWFIWTIHPHFWIDVTTVQHHLRGFIYNWGLWLLLDWSDLPLKDWLPIECVSFGSIPVQPLRMMMLSL